jgi:flagellar protein FliO/FliZ
LDGILQAITVLIIFIAVLAATTVVTKWIAGYQKAQWRQENLEVIETLRLSQNKYIQIIRVGNLYMAVGICKDTMTMLGVVEQDGLNLSGKGEGSSDGFQEILKRVKDRNRHDK